jgi:nucleoside-diphosphate-sugar epimerase
MNILILGVNGFIGHHLSTRILGTSDWRVYGMDMYSERIAPLLANSRFQFFEGDITINREWIEYHVKKCDVVLPLVAIATPATYVREPLRVFELDFEANLAIIRLCVKHRKRVLFPSTSEVYGMCHDSEFDPYASELVYGPIEKPRWIYACSKQLLDRVIHAYGMRDELDYTLFRPFNWIGPGLDNMHAAKEGSSRVITQFLGHIVRGENVRLVDGGRQRRCFTGISDGIDALMKMIDNRDGRANRRIAATYPEYRVNAAKVRLVDTTAAEYYGKGYQDVENRVPKIDNTRADLEWSPRVSMQEALRQIFDAYRGEIAQAGQLLEQEVRP